MTLLGIDAGNWLDYRGNGSGQPRRATVAVHSFAPEGRSVPALRLDATDVIPMQICACGQFFLRDLKLLSQFAHPAPDGHR